MLNAAHSNNSSYYHENFTFFFEKQTMLLPNHYQEAYTSPKKTEAVCEQQTAKIARTEQHNSHQNRRRQLQAITEIVNSKGDI